MNSRFSSLREDVPSEALPINYTSTGFLPEIGLHRRGKVFYQESSYSHWWLFGVMLLIALVVSLLPWHTEGAGGVKFKHFVAVGLIWGGICGLIHFFARNALGQTIVIDPQDGIVCIRYRGVDRKIGWNDILGLQICMQNESQSSSMSGFQLNLVWEDSCGAVNRHCLWKHGSRHFIIALGKRYEILFGFPLVDHTPECRR